MTTLCTIGYEGRRPEELVEVLRRNKVARVVDVRQLPLSRKHGFSKSALAATLAEHGIGYSNPRELGTPAPIRHHYKKTHDFAALTKAYLEYLTGMGDAVGELLETVRAERSCLLCFERDPAQCHRSLLAEVLAKRKGTKLKVVHL